MSTPASGPSRDLSSEGVEAARRIVERIESDEFDDEALARAVREASASARSDAS